MAVLTMAVQPLLRLSDHPFVHVLQIVLGVLILPGLIASTGVAGNIHAFSLFVAAVINAFIYSLLGWLLFSMVARIKRRR